MAALTLQPFLASDRSEPGSINVTPAVFPPTIQKIPSSPAEVAEAVVKAFNESLTSKNYSKTASFFTRDGYWRDHLCLSWNPQTLKSTEKIQAALEKECRLKSISRDDNTALKAPQIAPLDKAGEVQCLQFFITFDSKFGTGRGVVRMTEDDSGSSWKILTFFTTLDKLKDYEEATGHNRPNGVDHGDERDETNWKDKRQASTDGDYNPTVLIVGAGQGGLTVAARLKMLGIPALLVDKNSRIGDSWRNRYHQLVLHDPVWYDHLPYISFPSQWPVFTPKDKIADFFESYVHMLELDAWTKTKVVSSSWDEGKKEWTVTLERTKPDGSSETRTLHPRHVIQATGHSGKKNMPNIKGMETFKGDVLCHSSEFPGANPKSKGKTAVVVGSCNSAHDIAQDFYSRGYETYMIQRSSTCVVSSNAIMEISLKGLYDEDGPPTEDADLLFHSIPMEVFKQHQIGLTKIQNKHDEKLLSGLQKAGFNLDMGPGGAGFFIKYFQRGGGYYLDVGCSQLIIDGKIKIKSGVEPTSISEHEVTFSDGSVLKADEIVFATGYQNMRTEARNIFGDELADRVGDVWGFNEVGEMRNIWQRSGHPGFWFMGGNLALCRYYSRVLALQIKAIEEGLSTQ